MLNRSNFAYLEETSLTAGEGGGELITVTNSFAGEMRGLWSLGRLPVQVKSHLNIQYKWHLSLANITNTQPEQVP